MTFRCRSEPVGSAHGGGAWREHACEHRSRVLVRFIGGDLCHESPPIAVPPRLQHDPSLYERGPTGVQTGWVLEWVQRIVASCSAHGPC